MSLADTYNLRKEQASMSDVASFVDTIETLTTYTPSYTYNGTSVTLNTLNFAEYVKLGGGKLIHVQGSMVVTLVGTGAFLTASLPFAAKAGNYKCLSGFIALHSTPLVFEPVSCVVSGGVVNLIRNASALYTAANWDLYFSGTYYTT